jgi:hypothetical protein
LVEFNREFLNNLFEEGKTMSRRSFYLFVFSMLTVMILVVPIRANTTSLGDVNGDGRVDLKDLVIVAKAYGSSMGNSNWNVNADIDGDGTVSYRDVAILQAYFGQEQPEILNVSYYANSGNFDPNNGTRDFGFVNITATVENARSCILSYEDGSSWTRDDSYWSNDTLIVRTVTGQPHWVNLTMNRSGNVYVVTINGTELDSGWNQLPPLGISQGFQYRVYATDGLGNMAVSATARFKYTCDYSLIDP